MAKLQSKSKDSVLGLATEDRMAATESFRGIGDVNGASKALSNDQRSAARAVDTGTHNDNQNGSPACEFTGASGWKMTNTAAYAGIEKSNDEQKAAS